MKLEKTLDRITALIVQCCDPEEVLLFGSYAKGCDRPDSDLDLLVVGDFRDSPYLRAHEVQDLLSRFPIRIDLHLVTPQELAAASQKPFGFLKAIQINSVSLFKKTSK